MSVASNCPADDTFGEADFAKLRYADAIPSPGHRHSSQQTGWIEDRIFVCLDACQRLVRPLAGMRVMAVEF
jgi:hypothetical protein